MDRATAEQIAFLLPGLTHSMGNAMFAINALLNTPICKTTRGNITEDARMTATAKRRLRSGSSRLRPAKLSVVTVLDARPPIRPVKPIPTAIAAFENSFRPRHVCLPVNGKKGVVA